MSAALNGFSQKYEDKYNLDFEVPLISHQSTWIFIPDAFKISLDSVEKVHGKNSFLFWRSYLKREFAACLYQTILLPKLGKKIVVSVQTKTLLLQAAWLKVKIYDKNRILIRGDSISIRSENSWYNNQITLNSKIEFSMVEIEVWANESFKEKKKEVKLWIDDMRIVLDGIDLSYYNEGNFSFSDYEINRINNNSPLTSELNLPLKVLNEIGRRKIYGFGETTHGSKEINKSVFENIKQLISEKNCRLVLLELPIDIGIRLNQYVQVGFIDEDIKNIVTGITYDIDLFSSFLNWVKLFNVTAKDKVVIFGIDQYIRDTPRHINNFLQSKNTKSKTVDSLLNLINSSGLKLIPLEFAKKNATELSTLFQEGNYKLVLQYLKNRTDSMCSGIIPFKHSQDWNIAYRDYILWQNTKFATENINQKNSSIAIYAHFSHLNKNVPVFLTNIKSLGQYISEFFGDDYFLIGMLVGEGTISVKSILTSEYTVQKIYIPTHRSLEYLCSLSKESCFFYRFPVKTNTQISIRKIGAFYLENQQFSPSFNTESMNAIIFINRSNNSSIYQNNSINRSDIYDLYKKSQSKF